MSVIVNKNILPWGASNRPGTKLGAGQLHITVHETGDTRIGATARAEIAYLQTSEARTRVVSYHLSVDDIDCWQGLPLSEIGYHAGDGCDSPSVDVGCYRSVAIELCVNKINDPVATSKARRNLAEIIARIANNDPAFDWGSGESKGRFSIEFIDQHNFVSDDRKDCPHYIRAQNFWPTLMTWVDEEWAKLHPGEAEVPTYKKPIWFPPFNGDDQGRFKAVKRNVHVRRGGGALLYAYAAKGAPASGKPIKDGSSVPIIYTVYSDGSNWYIHEDGHRMLRSHFHEQLSWSNLE